MRAPPPGRAVGAAPRRRAPQPTRASSSSGRPAWRASHAARESIARRRASRRRHCRAARRWRASRCSRRRGGRSRSSSLSMPKRHGRARRQPRRRAEGTRPQRPPRATGTKGGGGAPPPPRRHHTTPSCSAAAAPQPCLERRHVDTTATLGRRRRDAAPGCAGSMRAADVRREQRLLNRARAPHRRTPRRTTHFSEVASVSTAWTDASNCVAAAPTRRGTRLSERGSRTGIEQPIIFGEATPARPVPAARREPAPGVTRRAGRAPGSSTIGERTPSTPAEHRAPWTTPGTHPREPQQRPSWRGGALPRSASARSCLSTAREARRAPRRRESALIDDDLVATRRAGCRVGTPRRPAALADARGALEGGDFRDQGHLQRPRERPWRSGATCSVGVRGSGRQRRRRPGTASPCGSEGGRGRTGDRPELGAAGGGVLMKIDDGAAISSELGPPRPAPAVK